MELQMGMKADSLFLSTLPVRGATPRSASATSGRNIFLSTLPVRGATLFQVVVQPKPDLSIHAPREGSDTFSDFGRTK